MTRKLLTVEEFRASAKNGSVADSTVMRITSADPELGADDSRTIRFVFSDGTVDRSGDSIDPQGWEIDAFLDNPVALWAHDSYSPPIGRAANVGPVGSKLMGDIEFMPADISPFADSVFRMIKGGFVKAVSVGFMPLEWKFVQSNDRPFGIDFTKQELLEISVCPVPCNPNALQEAKAQGIDIAPLREWASKLLDDGSQVLVPRNLLEETFRLAKTPRNVRQKYLAKDGEDWKVGAARDLPIDEADSWDGPAAAKRMLDEAGFDGDKPDTTKARRGFLLYDGANPTLRGSYKLPFADIVGGTLKAIKAGISAAKGRLDQTEAPKAVLDDAGTVIASYEKRIADEKTIDPTVKSGRSISSANAAKLREALDHHASASKCIKDVLASNTDDDGEGDDDGDVEDDVQEEPEILVPDTEASRRAARLAEAKRLKDTIQN